jgi:hypothetical protein
MAYLRGYIRKATSMPGAYDKKAARSVSNTNPKSNTQLLAKTIDQSN